MNKIKFINQQIITLLLFYIIISAIYIVKSSLIGLLLYFLLLLMCLKNKNLPFAIIGSANYLPIIFGISPIVVSIIIMIITIFAEVLFKRLKLKLIKITRIDILFIIMMIWTFITGMVNHNMSFFSGMATSILFYIVIKLYYANISVKSEEILEYLIIGICSGIIFALFIKFGLLGFESYHNSRYAIGERSDPNSTGFLFAIISMYFFLNFICNLQYKTKSIIVNIFLFILSLSCLLLTQSRGSVICLVISIAIYISFNLFKINRLKIKVIFNIIIIFILILVSLAFFKPITNFVTESWNKFENRLINAESNDGERSYLIRKSFRAFLSRPITGTSLEAFEIEAGHIPHNTFCDYMVTNGIFGIIFYIIYFVLPIIQAIKSKSIYINIKPFYCYFVAFLNILFYSASNEKIIFLLLVILILSEEETRKESVND